MILSTKVATTLAENGHKQDTQTGTALYNIREEKYRTPEEKVEEPISP
jgi:hypothetical protein